ncbi:dolichol kinase [Mactra antiquata]
MTLLKEYSPVLLGFFVYFVNSCVGLSQYFQSGLILPLGIVTYIVQHKLKTSQPTHYRYEDSGLWCVLLMLAISYAVEHEGNVLIRLVTPVTLLVYVNTNLPYTEWKTSQYSVGVLLFIHGVTTSRIFYRDIFSMLLVFLCCAIFIHLLHKLPLVFKKCFTYGEICVLLQLYVCEIYVVLLYTVGLLRMNAIEKVSVVIFIGVHVAIMCFYMLSRYDISPLYQWLVMCSIGIFYIITSLIVNFNTEEILNLLQLVILAPTSIFLVIWWILWVVSSLLLVGYYGNTTFSTYSKNKKRLKSGHKSVYDKTSTTNNSDNDIVESNDDRLYQQISNSCENKDNDDDDDNDSNNIYCDKSDGSQYFSQKSDFSQFPSMKSDCSQFSSHRSETFMLLRKYFHLAILCVYVPGLIFAPTLLYIASTVAAAVLILAEAIRYMKIEPVGSILNDYLNVFLDEQDEGDLILTPIYLILGCSLPLWWNIKIIYTQCTFTIYSGLISVGVGDAMASYIGRKYGKHKWPGSKKSVEGTLAAFIAQLLAVTILQCFGISGAIVTMETVLCILLISLLEAFTLQIDNLIIPIYSWMLFTSLQPTF